MSAEAAVNDLLNQYIATQSKVAPTSVVITLGATLAVSGSTLLLFSILRPRNKLIYAPKLKYSTEEKRPPKVDDGLLSWVRPLTATKEPQMLVEMGMDAVVFLRFLRMCRYLFASIALLCCGVLMPINIVYNIRNVPSKSRTFLSMLTISNVKGSFLYAHVAMSYIICFLAFWFIWVNYRRVVELKHAFFRSGEYNNSLHARSIMITGVGRRNQTDEGLQAMLSALGIPYPTTAVHIGRRVGHLPELVEEHNNAVRELEQVLTTYTKGGKLASKRPTMKIGSFMGCGGRRVDTIDHMSARIKLLEDRVNQARETITDRKSEPYGFASFSAVPYAHVVARRLRQKKIKGSTFSLAPLPSDIIWRNLAANKSSNFIRRLLIAVFLIFFCALYTAPLAAVSALANLTAITQYVPFLKDWQSKSNWSFSAVVGLLPPLLSVILQLLLPVIMRALTRRQGLLTLNQVNRAVLARYFTFLIVSQLVIFSLLGVVYNVITELVIEFGKGGEPLRVILNEVHALPSRIQNTYLDQSSYWLTWLPLRAYSAVFDLAQIVNLIWVWGRTRIFGRTPREIREWTKPPGFDYAVYGANSLLICAVSLIYAPLAPLVPLLAAVAFFCSSMIYKYQLLYVCISEVESGGRMWRPYINRLLACLIFQQLILVLTIGLQEGWYRSISCFPPVLLVLVFKIVLSRKFDERYNWYLPSDQEVAEAVVHRSDARKGRLHKRFGNPALTDDLFTPTIHKESQHLLPQIYRGRMAEDDYINMYQGDKALPPAESAGNIVQTGGITFQAVAPENLTMSRAEYIREQEGWETGSVSTAVADGGRRTDAAQALFESKKREYLASGPSRPSSPGVSEGYARGDGPEYSTDNLLYNAAGRGAGGVGMHPTYSQANEYPQYSGRRASGMDYEDIGMQYPYAAASGYFEPGYSQYPDPGYGRTPLYQQVSGLGSEQHLPPGATYADYGGGSPAPSYPPSQNNSPVMTRGQSSQGLVQGHRQQPSNGSQHAFGRY